MREFSELDLVSVAVKASLSFWWLLGGCVPPPVRDALVAAVAMPLPQWACPLFVAWCSGCKAISDWPEVSAPFPDATGVVLKISRSERLGPIATTVDLGIGKVMLCLITMASAIVMGKALPCLVPKICPCVHPIFRLLGFVVVVKKSSY